MKPFIRWAGGKRSIAKTVAPVLVQRLKETGGRYHEPFLGSGAVALEVLETFKGDAFLSDICDPLINMYFYSAESPRAVFADLAALKNIGVEKENYLAVRSKQMNGLHGAAIFLYLNALSFNGLWRVNKKGEYNVPYNNKGSKAKFASLDELTAFSQLTKASGFFAHNDFRVALRNVRKGDVVFIDSPYYGTFSSYTKTGFDDKDHIDLARLLKDIHEAGGHFLCTNSDTQETRNLYRFAHCAPIKEKRNINRDGAGRGPVPCLLIASDESLLKDIAG